MTARRNTGIPRLTIVVTTPLPSGPSGTAVLDRDTGTVIARGTPDEARETARQLLACADAAERMAERSKEGSSEGAE